MTNHPFLIRVEVFFGAWLCYQRVYLISPVKGISGVLSKERILADMGSETHLLKMARDIVVACSQSKWERGLKSLHCMPLVKINRSYSHRDHGHVTEAVHFTRIDYIQVDP